MKKIFLIFALGAMVAACSPDNNGNEVSGDDTTRYVCDFEGPGWNALIDNPQYNGDLLYKGETYSWYDPCTDLEHSNSAGGYEWDGVYYYTASAFMAVSNYLSTDYAENGSSMEQLTVYGSAMHSGSNCVVCNGYKSTYGDNRPTLSFRNEAAYIESVWIANTAYFYNVALNGNSFAKPLATESVWVRATGYTLDAEGNEVEGSALDFYLYKGGKDALNGGWKKWDLSALGKVNKVKFDVQWNGEGGADNFMHPAYFALDDITVVKE